MLWELGIDVGNTNRCAIVPVSKDNLSLTTFTRDEYLKLYPYIDITNLSDTQKYKIWVNEDANTYIQFESWINGSNPIYRK